MLPGQDSSREVPRLVPRRQGHHEKNQTAITDYTLLMELAAHPLLHDMADHLRELLSTPYEVGGRPRTQPYWAMVMLFCSLTVYGSVSRASRNLGDPRLWAQIVDQAQPLLSGGDVPPAPTGPTRHHYQYLARRLDDLGDEVYDEFVEQAAALLAEIVASLTTDDARRSNRPERHTTLGIDGKVMNSPQAHNVTERIDKKTGEVRPARVDTARGGYHEGGGTEVVIGSKWAIISGRVGGYQGLRIVGGLAHVPDGDGRGEAGAFVDLAKQACDRMPFVNTIVTDGALRGNAIADIQTHTGAAVVCPPRRKDRQHGGYLYNGTYYAGKRLPSSQGRRRAFKCCSGHDLHAFAGAIFDKQIASDGTSTYQLVDRGQEKRQRGRDGTYQFRAQHRLFCPETQQTHIWWEALTPTDEDAAAKFLRNEYVRSVPPSHPDYATIYGWRSDTESFHAQLEQTFHKRRLPAWGAKRQRLVMIFTAMTYNIWAHYIWRTELQRQAQPPPQAA